MLLVLAAILYFVFRPGPSAAELYAAGSDLMQSDNPADWDRAWDDYLGPLSRKYPDKYADEVKAFDEKVRGHRELRRAIDAGK